jgi:hypothetical protein
MVAMRFLFVACLVIVVAGNAYFTAIGLLHR